jgi:hypothetical protein
LLANLCNDIHLTLEPQSLECHTTKSRCTICRQYHAEATSDIEQAASGSHQCLKIESYGVSCNTTLRIGRV